MSNKPILNELTGWLIQRVADRKIDYKKKDTLHSQVFNTFFKDLEIAKEEVQQMFPEIKF